MQVSRNSACQAISLVIFKFWLKTQYQLTGEENVNIGAQCRNTFRFNIVVSTKLPTVI